MKHIFLLVVMVAMVATQFSIPDISAVGQAIKNGVVSAEQTVENFAKEEIQNAGNLIHQGVEKVSHLVDSAPNTPAPQPVQAPKDKTQPLPKPTVINTEFAVSAQVAITTEAPKTEAKPVEHQNLAVQSPKVPEVIAKPKDAIIAEPIEQAAKEHRKGPKHDHKPHRERKEEVSSDSDSDSSEDIEERRHKEEKKDRKEHKKHDHSGQNMKQRREERERRIKQKQEHMKKYQNKHAQRHSDDREERIQRNPMNQQPRGRMNGVENPYGNIKIEAMNERVKLVMP